MNKAFLAVAGSLLALTAAPASAIIVADAQLGETNSDGAGGTIAFNVVDPSPPPGPGFTGPITAELRHRFAFTADENLTQAFVDTFEFTTPVNGTGAVTFSTTASNLLQSLTFSGFVGDVTFETGAQTFDVSILANGHLANLENIPIIANLENTLTIRGIAHGNAFYNGSATFAPAAAVPEPATWALLTIGFGAIGGRMRHKNKAKWATTALAA